MGNCLFAILMYWCVLLCVPTVCGVVCMFIVNDFLSGCVAPPDGSAYYSHYGPLSKTKNSF